MADDDEGVFKRALKNERDVTKSYFADFGFDASRSEANLASEQAVKRLIRPLMEAGAGGGRLFNLKEEAAPYLSEAADLLRDGKVAAVDGTTALTKIDFMNMSQYACAIGWLTSRLPAEPHISITETSSAYIQSKRLAAASLRELEALCEELDEARNVESWPNTWREHKERRAAVEECDVADVVLIDGPLVTQNLVSQDEGRELLTRLTATPKLYIGVIKNVSGSWTLCKWVANATEMGEGYLFCSIADRLRQRFGWNEAITKWTDTVNDIWRVVFRPADKVFALECPADQIGLVCAILQLNQSPTLNHELPLLMETIDAQLRANFNGETAKQAILNRIMQGRIGYRAAIDAIDERDFR